MDKLKIWVDDVCPAPSGWTYIHSTDEMLKYWDKDPNFDLYIDTISLGCKAAGILDYMNMLFNDFYKDHGWNYQIKYHLHSGESDCTLNMRKIIMNNGWIEIDRI